MFELQYALIPSNQAADARFGTADAWPALPNNDPTSVLQVITALRLVQPVSLTFGVQPCVISSSN